MDTFFDRLAHRATTIDELVSGDFEVLPGQKTDADLAARRLAAWCRASTSGDWTLFARRLAKDGLTFECVLALFASARRKRGVPQPLWLNDAQWVFTAMTREAGSDFVRMMHDGGPPLAFEDLLNPIVECAYQQVRSKLPQQGTNVLSKSAEVSMCRQLALRLSELTGAALFGCFVGYKKQHLEASVGSALSCYSQFIEEMRTDKLRQLFDAKPVLLRLVASVTRQWIDATAEFVERLNRDIEQICAQFVGDGAERLVVHVGGGIADLHNGGRSVLIVRFSNGTEILYKPKSLRVDSLWCDTVNLLNSLDPPIDMKAASVISSEGYGWGEFIHHAPCSHVEEFDLFFRRAGSWLCLFHMFVSNDMHEENVIASGSYPVPIDLETILQGAETNDDDPVIERQAFQMASRVMADSVMITGLLPAYGRSPENQVFAHGGLHNQGNLSPELRWENINTDSMRPSQQWEQEPDLPNLPFCDGQRGQLGDHVAALVKGYEDYAEFLLNKRDRLKSAGIFEAFAGAPVRRLLRPTRFYALLLGRLRDHRNMSDGIEWSAHLDFMTRLMDWDKAHDPWWPLMKAERQALTELNVPHFTSPTNADEISDGLGISCQPGGDTGLARAEKRFDTFDSHKAALQGAFIRLSTSTVSRANHKAGDIAWPCAAPDLRPAILSDHEGFLEQATKVGRHLKALAIRSGPGAAWIGLDWLRDSEVCNLAPLGADFYGGSTGISVFLAALAASTHDGEAADLSLAGVCSLRHELRSINAARYARALGVGGSSGMGSVVYAFTLLANLLDMPALLEDATIAASLIDRDLIASDKAFDVMDGSAGAILGLSKLYRKTGDSRVLSSIKLCADHLLANRPTSEAGSGLWISWGLSHALNGMSHGAAGFGLAFSALTSVTGELAFLDVVRDCLQFEANSFCHQKGNWPDYRRDSFSSDAYWPCHWCHGAGGIGLARLGMMKHLLGAPAVPAHSTLSLSSVIEKDIRSAVRAVEVAYPYPFDTLCCGNLGNIELITEASRSQTAKASDGGMSTINLFDATEKGRMANEGSRRMAAIISAAEQRGDYLWDVGDKRFNLGLFRGVSGVGYSLLRLTNPSLPNLLFWE